MNDTRLWPIKDDIEIALRGIRDITDSSSTRNGPPDQSEQAFRLQQHLVNAHRAVVELMHPDIPLCLKYSTVGSCCYRQAEHEGAHRSEWGSTWTDESDRRTADAIAASMKGRRD